METYSKTLKPTWKNILYTGHKIWCNINEARDLAMQAGYTYFVWEDYIHYTSTGKKTKLKESDVN
jgi:hypothetical protein